MTPSNEASASRRRSASSGSPLRRAPERRHGRYGILDIDPAGNTQRAPFDNAAGRHQIVPVVAPLEQRHVTGVKIARLVVRIAVNPDTGVPDLQIDTLLDDQRPALADLSDELRKSLAQCLVRTVNIQMIGIGRGDHRHVGPQPQERTVELVGLDRQTPPPAEHQVTRKIPGNTTQESASAARHPVVEPCHERRGRGFAVRTGHRYHEFPLRKVPQHLRTLDDLEPVLPEPAQFGVIRRNCRRIDHDRRGRIPEISRNQRRILLIVNNCSFGLDLVREMRPHPVVPRHPSAFVEEIPGQSTHADPPDSEKIYVELHSLFFRLGRVRTDSALPSLIENIGKLFH